MPNLRSFLLLRELRPHECLRMSSEDDASSTSVSRPEHNVQAGQRVGRFSILGHVRDGGADRVYEAYDPQLDRRVALKLLNDAGSGTRRERLLTEAQALARLDHPNVVTVHDVGMHEGTLFVAMEFAHDASLRDWLGQSQGRTSIRTRRALGLLLGAGRGLSAAHAVGLIHRDVRPSNVLVLRNGRARIANFAVEGGTDSLVRGQNSPPPESFSYGAPESLRGESLNRAADQFSYCVMVWEAVYGVHPFEGATVEERLVSIERGCPKNDGNRGRVPDYAALLRRGLSFDPLNRYESLEQLVDALDELHEASAYRQHAVWRRWGLALAGVASIAVAAAYQLGVGNQRCSSWANDSGDVWNDEERSRLRDGFALSDLDFAAQASERMEVGIDEFVDRWSAARVEACEATHVRGEQSSERFDAQIACLDDAKKSAGAVLELLSAGTGAVLSNGSGLLSGLPETRHCESALGVPTPDEETILRTLRAARALRSADQGLEAAGVMGTLLDGVDDTTTPIVRAKVLLEHGRIVSEYDPRRAIDPLSSAFSIARAGGLDHLAASAAREVARAHAASTADPVEVQTWLDLAHAEGITLSTPERSEMLALEGTKLRLAGDLSGAAAAFERRIEVVSGTPTLRPDAFRLFALELVRQAGEIKRAAEVGRRALAEYQDIFGASHPGAAQFESDLARILGAAGEADEAERIAQDATRRAESVWGQGHTYTSPFLGRQARLKCGGTRDGDEGLSLAQRALELQPKDPPSLARRWALDSVRICAASRNADVNLRTSKELLELTEQLFGAKHHAALYDRVRYAFALLRAHKQQEAREQLWLASPAAKERLQGWELNRAIDVHRQIGAAASMLGEGALGLEHAEAAVELVNVHASTDAWAKARAHNALCRATLNRGELDRALSECRAALMSSPADKWDFLAEVEYGLGLILFHLGRNEEALVHVLASVELLENTGVHGPGSRWLALAHIRLGEINERLAKDLEAEAHFRTSFELLKSLEQAEKFVAGAGLVRTLARVGRGEEAAELLEQLRQLPPDLYGMSTIFETQGYLRHLEDPSAGAEDYSKAFDYLRIVALPFQISRFCDDAPFEVSGCPANEGSRSSTLSAPAGDGRR